MIKDWLPDMVKAEHAEAFRAKLNEAQNFFKHAERDPKAALEFEAGQTDVLLLDACWAFRRLARERLPLLGVFELWAFLTFAAKFVTHEGADQLSPEYRQGLATLSRQAFFDKMIAVAYDSVGQKPAGGRHLEPQP